MMICIDPGHGMDNATPGKHDPGNMGGGIRESRLALIYASALEQQLLAREFDVVLTRRSQDQPMPVGNRAKMAERAGANLMISLHTNSAVDKYGGIDPVPHGAEVKYNRAADHVLADYLMRATASALGVKIREALPDSRGLAIMKASIPVYLIELAFQFNAADRDKLLATDSPIRVATALAIGLRAHYSEQLA